MDFQKYNPASASKPDWSDGFVADPHFYTDPQGIPFGAFALNEGVMTILPKDPQARYHVDGRQVPRWRLLLYSRTTGKVLGDTEFFSAVRRLALAGCIVDENQTHYLIRGLRLTELDALYRQNQ